MNILVPKAIKEQARWQAALVELTDQVTFCDPWSISVIPESPAMKSHWLNLDLFNGVVCVSPTAAEVLIEALDQYWPMPPARIHWLCNGERTARVLKQGGLSPSYPESGFTAEDVLALPEAQVQQGDKWLIVKGEGGRVTLAETFTERGATATELAVYHRSLDEQTLNSMATLADKADALWLSSSFLGEALLESNKEYWLSWSGQWWLSSERLRGWAEQSGLQNLKVAPGATVDALKSLMQ